VSATPAQTRRSPGFTLIEVLAVVLLTGIVLAVAIDFYRDLAHASQAAVVRAGNARRAAVLLDRVARDLQSAVLVKKPQGTDPLADPWIFLAEADQTDLGADRIKFVSRGRRPRSTESPESDLEMVAWILDRGPDDELELRRWSQPNLPEGLDRSFPPRDDTETVATDLAAFGVRFQADDGSWVSRWDSSTLTNASQLPVAAEISVTLYEDADSDATDGPYLRRVLLPLRPLDLDQQLAAGGAGGQGQEARSDEAADADGDGNPDTSDTTPGCVTVAVCLSRHPEILNALGNSPVDQAAIQSVSGQCASSFAGAFPIAIPPDCMQ